MDLTLIAILGTVLFTLSFQALRNADLPGPAGRRRAIPRYQRRVLVCLAVVCLCLVLDAYLLTRGGGAPRPRGEALALPDGLALLGLLVAWACLRPDATRSQVVAAAGALGVFALGVMAAWTTVAFAASSEAGVRFAATLRSAWGTSGGAAGLVALFHYLLAPALLAAAVAAHDRWAQLREWEKDTAFRPLALLSSVLALGYLLFTVGVVTA